MKRFSLVAAALAAVLCLSGCEDKHAYDGHYTLAFSVIGVLMLMFFILAMYTNLLRDDISDCDEFDDNVAKKQAQRTYKLLNPKSPYSLSKTQFAGWTMIIASAYIYLSLCKGDCADGVFSATALTLMGIGSGIAVGAAIIDKREMQENRPRHQNRPSTGFFIDILSDDNGISIHRFQNFVWTVIAMIVYISKVAHVQSGCVLPELSDTLLTLTGISGATFLTLRATENKPPAIKVPDTPPTESATTTAS